MKAFNDILGSDIPNILKHVQSLENKLTPELIKLNAHRNQIPAEILAKFDQSMAELKATKEKLKEYGINSN